MLGALAVIAAVFSWALDNVLTRPFAELDPAALVRVKSLCGVVLTGTLALLMGEALPTWLPVAGLLACGATGYASACALPQPRFRDSALLDLTVLKSPFPRSSWSSRHNSCLTTSIVWEV